MYEGNGHAVTVTGVEYDSNGKSKTVYITDTGTGNCLTSISADKFEESLLDGFEIAVTSKPVW